MKQKLFMIIQYCAILKTVTTNSMYRSGLVVVGFVSLLSSWGLQTQLKSWVNNHSNNMKSTTNKSPWSQQWEKSFYQTTTKWRMQERSRATGVAASLWKW